MLCATCMSMFLTRVEDGKHHQTRSDMLKAADLGCRLCLCCVTQWGDSLREDDEERDSHFVYALHYDTRPVPHPNITISLHSKDGLLVTSKLRKDIYMAMLLCKNGPTPPEYSRFVEEVRDDMSNGSPWQVRQDGFPSIDIPDDTGDSQVAILARLWLEDCLHGHGYGSCGIDTRPRSEESRASGAHRTENDLANPALWQPKRLIDLSSTETKLKLVLRETHTITEGYAALSHCWGTSKFFTLTADNFQDILDDKVSIETLPKTFREVIEVCRLLEIRYLWIDSICILQSGPGHEEDWQLQAAEMAMVYSQCILNIAVNAAANADEGAFRKRNTALLRPCYVSWAPQDQPFDDDLPFGSRDLESQPHHPLVYVLCSKDLDSGARLQVEPLAKRGWVVQERYLSPRVLYFSTDRIFWECNTRRYLNEYSWCLPRSFESWDKGVQAFSREGDRSFALPDLLFKQRPLTAREQLRCTWDWFDLVENYSKCRLTYPDKDKFSAIAGIARRFGEQLGEDYFAGLFRSNFPWGLMWYRAQTWESVTSENRAPSWSWAKSDTPVTFNIKHQHFTDVVSNVEVMDVEGVLAHGTDPYGGMQEAKLVIKGVLLTHHDLTVLTRTPDEYPQTPGPHIVEESDHNVVYYEDDYDLYERQGNQNQEQLSSNASDPVGLIAAFRDLYMLHIGDVLSSRETSVGLMLEKNIPDDTYRRVGMWEATFWRLGRTLDRRGYPHEIITIV